MRNEEILDILKKEFGIASMRELDEAIKKLPKIDLKPFTGSVIKKPKENLV